MMFYRSFLNPGCFELHVCSIEMHLYLGKWGFHVEWGTNQ